MRLLFIAFLSVLTLNATGFWTLTGVTKANIYVNNSADYLKPKTIIEIKKKMQSMLHQHGIQTQQQDSPTLMLSIEEIVEDDTHYVYLKLALGEEVKTFRKGGVETFALSYAASDFIDTDVSDLDEEVLGSVDFLLESFAEQFEDDKD